MRKFLVIQPEKDLDIRQFSLHTCYKWFITLYFYLFENAEYAPIF